MLQIALGHRARLLPMSRCGAPCADRREPARVVFDWPVVIGQYHELWWELSERRQAARDQPISQLSYPLRDDPYAVFRGDASRTLDDDRLLESGPNGKAHRLQPGSCVPMNSFAHHLLCPAEEPEQLVQLIAAHGSVQAGDLSTD